MRSQFKFEGFNPFDGSGLSRENRVSTLETVELLRSLKTNKVFKESLSESGKSGTLKKRLTKHKVLAKTGTLRDVKALSGYLEAGSNQFIFSIIVNHSSDTSKSQNKIDAIIQKLAQLKAK